MEQGRKELNWQAICKGRDLLKELEVLKREAKREFEAEFRKQVAAEILNPTEFRYKTGIAGDSLD